MSVEIQRTEVVLNNRGARGNSGLVLVSSATGQAVSSRMGLAAISSPAAGQVAFLTEAGREGMFAFDSSDLTAAVGADPAQAIYVAPASATSGISGAWVRRYNGAVSAKWFGAVGDGTTNDATALQRWLDHGGRLYLPVGEYYSASKLIVRKNVVIEGEGYGFDSRIVDGSATLGYDNQPGARIRFAAGVGGFDIQPQSTVTDETTSPAATQEGAMHSVIRNLALVGAGTGATATGLYARTIVHLENVHTYKFQGKGFDISAAGGPGNDTTAEYGNASFTTLTNCLAVYNGSHGFHVRGVDANIVKFDNCWSQLNGGWGFLDESFLGSIYIGGQAATNTSGSYKCIGGNAPSAYLGCYVEVGTGRAPDLSSLCVVHGGVLSSFARLYNVGTSGQPTITGGTGLSTGKVSLLTPQAAEGAITDRCVIYRGYDTGLVLQGEPDTGGTYCVTVKNGSDSPVFQIGKATGNAYFHAPIFINGNQIITDRQALIAAPVGGATADAEARTAIASILGLLRTHGLMT